MYVVYWVEHRGQHKMVGKVFPLVYPEQDRPAREQLVFLHQQSGSQPHIKTDSPGGIDAVVLDHLLACRVDQIHHHDRRSDTVYLTTPDDVFHYGVREDFDGRDRYFLPRRAWRERRSGLWYQVPYIQGNDKLFTAQDIRRVAAGRQHGAAS